MVMKRICLRPLLLAAVITAFSIMCILTVPGSNTSGPFAAQKESSGEPVEKAEALKDETVYGILNHDGTVDSLYVVNRFNVLKGGVYTDFGDYAEIENLTDGEKPEISGDAIQWNLKKSSGGFYYKGVLKTKELPWDFDIRYTLDGSEISAEDLAGKKGKVGIIITVSPDEKSEAYFRDNYAIQMQVPVNLSSSTVINADGATRVVTGSTETLTYTVLPGTSGTYSITLETECFEMDGINIGILAADYSSVIDTGDISKGFASLSDGMGEMISGTSKLKDGMEKLAGGIGEMLDGHERLSHNGSAIINGMEDYKKGLGEFSSSLASLAGGSKEIKSGLSQIAPKGKALTDGYRQIEETLKAKLPTREEKEQLKWVAQFADSSDEAAARMGSMALSMLEQIEGIEQLYNAISTLNSGLDQYTSGVSEIADNYGDFDSGISRLPEAAEELSKGYSSLLEGNKQFIGGLSSLKSGMSALNEEAKAVPEGIQKLIDGQNRIKDGVAEAEQTIKEISGGASKEKNLVSFVSPRKASVNSVQFLLRTPGIAAPEEKSPVQDSPAVETGFFEKLTALFRKR
ncbi:hypothetical protein CDQ83_12380 [Clostridium thermosuccinogenes]|nr:hypothetical protein CDQ83_12380 [Pseudoclostridium thermosuccinogenes]